MPNRFRVSTGFPVRLQDLGISPAAVLRQAGLPDDLFERERISVTTSEMFALYRAIGEVHQDPAVGLNLGTEARTERYDPIAIAALCTRSLRDGMERMARYKQLTCPEKIDVFEDESECAIRFSWLLAEQPEPSLLIDTCFAWIVSVARRGTGTAIQPKRVEFTRPAVNREMYEAHFGCPVTFEAEQNLIVFRKSDMDIPFVTHNAELLAMVAPQLETELNRRISEKSVPEQVKAVLKGMLAGQRPALEDVARQLRVSTRTLQRRLTEEGVTFQQLVKEARRELARHYLLHASLDLNETAYLLGYEDANSFFRAFQSWEGTSPGEWRASRAASA